MLNFGWSELLVIAVVAIVVVGPKDLPRALRTVGQWTARIRRMASEFQNQFTEAIKEAELDAVKRDIEEIGRIDPVADVRAAANKVGRDIQRDLDKSGPSGPEREPYPWETSETPSWETKPTTGPQAVSPPAAPAPPTAPAPLTAPAPRTAPAPAAAPEQVTASIPPDAGAPAEQKL